MCVPVCVCVYVSVCACVRRYASLPRNSEKAVKNEAVKNDRFIILINVGSTSMHTHTHTETHLSTCVLMSAKGTSLACMACALD